MILAVDIGNTNVVLGVYKGKQLVTHWRVSTEKHRTSDEYGMIVLDLFRYTGMDFSQITAVVVSSVVPPLTPIVERMSSKFFGVEAMVVDLAVKTGITIGYDNPREVGADRIVNALAAYTKYGGPVIVVDFGTATTFDAISADGEYLGGAIAPGIGIAADALFTHTAKLPKIELARPKCAIGRNTVASMQSGIVYGFAGQVDELVRRIKNELGGRARVVATGGMSSVVASEIKSIEEIDPWLTLEGLRMVYEMNAQRPVEEDQHG